MPRKSNPEALAISSSASAGIDERQQQNNGDHHNHLQQLPSPNEELNKHIRHNNERRRNHNVTTATTTTTTPLSPLSPATPKSPRSPFKFSLKPASHNNNSGRPPMQVPEALQRDDESRIELATSPTSSFHHHSDDHLLNQTSSTGGSQEGSKRSGKGGFFSNYKASKSTSKVNANRPQVPDESMPLDQDQSLLEMTSKLAVSSAAEAKNNGSELMKTVTRKPVGGNAKSSDVSLALSTDSTTSDTYAHSNMAATTTQTATSTAQGKKNKAKPFGILGRSRSTRDKNKDRENKSVSETQSPRQQSPSERSQRSQNGRSTPNEQTEPPRPPQQAHLAHHENEKFHDNRSLKDNMGGSSQRQNSKDRRPAAAKGESSSAKEQHSKSQQSISSNGSNGGHTFLSNLNSFGTKAADKIHKSIFSKVGRSNSANEKESVVDDDHYVLKVLNRPLLEQTRKTRISKRLEDSRDKTEFWMPAFPWRAIDYLNYKGCEVEGLYRVPGSGPQIKAWQRKFDEQGDVDLFEQEDLYDINIIGSMLKQWFRELPDELFPKSSQDRVARECNALNITPDDVEHVPVPQVLIDELSNLSPFNYYLLFAITCHLSLLLNHSEKNKMDFRNLCICFQPCMKIDALCFKFLVCDWRSCWKGCKTEGAYVEQEYQLFDMPPPGGTIQGEPPVTNDGRSSLAIESVDERNVSSSGSSKPSSVSVAAESIASKSKNAVPTLPLSQSQNSSQTSTATQNYSNGGMHYSQGHTVNGNGHNYNKAAAAGLERISTPRGSQEDGSMRPLSPIKPLSPMGL